MVKVGDKIKVVEEDIDHPFKKGEILTVTELLDYGCVWAKNSDKELGCLILTEYELYKKGKK